MNKVIIILLTLLLLPLYGNEITFNTQDFPPYSYEADGEVKGPITEIITLIANEMNIQYSFKLLSWPRAQKEVKDGDVHAMFAIGWNEDRAKWLHFSPPILEGEYGFFVKNDNNLIFRDIFDISNYNIGVYGPSNTSFYLEKIYEQNSNFNIIMRSDDRSSFLQLSNGRVTAVYSNRDVGNAMLKRLNIKNVRYAGTHKRLKYYIGFSTDINDPRFLNEFDRVFSRFYEDGTIPDILMSYDLQAITNE